MKKILVATNKHETNYFAFTTKEEQESAALKVFETNNGLEYYYDLEDDGELDELVDDLKKAHKEWDSLSKIDGPSGKILDVMRDLKEVIARLPKEIRERREQIALYQMAKRGDAQAAMKLISLRKHYEYESIEVEDLK
jgi:hypothetical protein